MCTAVIDGTIDGANLDGHSLIQRRGLVKDGHSRDVYVNDGELHQVNGTKIFVCHGGNVSSSNLGPWSIICGKSNSEGHKGSREPLIQLAKAVRA